jgi:hypothetical protein
MKNWKDGKPVEIKTPAYIRDNIHADLLAAVYAQFATEVASMKQPFARSNPSGYTETQGKFAQRVAREVKSRTGWTCELQLAQQTDFGEPMHRVNTVSAANSVVGWSETLAWDEFTRFYAE